MVRHIFLLSPLDNRVGSVIKAVACFLTGASAWPMILAIILAILVCYCMQHKEDLLAMLPH
jgi:hypothetical protein